MNDLLEFLEEPSLTKAQLVAQLRESMGLTQREARDLVDAFFEVIATRLSRGEEVKIANFGNFELRTTASRPGLSEFLCSRLRVGSIDSDEPAPHITRQVV